MELTLCRLVFVLVFLCINVEASGTQDVSRYHSSDPLVKHLVYRLAEDIQQMKKDITTLQKDHKEDIKTLKNDCTEDIKALAKKLLDVLQKLNPDKGSGCPKDFYAPFRGSCYQFVSTPVSWYQAFYRCRQAGAHLVSIETREEDQHLVSYIRKAGLSVPHYGFWLSGTDVAEEGTWIWASSGRQVAYSNFDAGQPDNGSGTEHCLHLNKQKGYRWNDDQCDAGPTGYICEIQAK